ncbi:murein transglycosylase A [Pleomorphomonas sp. JP5]|uniref:murein transglycosylase A n=1 Tax=Pleomorphomonas sp. JP5 TaxID=2942998 RepID=UPI0020433A3B|nr:MltA domain-containing protein [Pleomorphomonas sp. JP5]MCM5559722.1 MltA domain-containing protein [Pleomorphomonas sp. JP5]
MADALPAAHLVEVDFSDLAGWADDDHAAAFIAFRRSAVRLAEKSPTTKALGPDGMALVRKGQAALALDESVDRTAARAFFESHFRPFRIEPASGEGFVTGFFEPEVDARLQPSLAFPIPLLEPPRGLRELYSEDDRHDLDPSLTWALEDGRGGLIACPDRRAIMAGALDGRTRVIAYVKSAVEAFFIHVQGAARLRLPDGKLLRVTFAGKSGHAYFPVARLMLERGVVARASEATADALREWLEGLGPQERRAALARNPSYIFFREAPVDDPTLGPIAAAGVPLTAGRSLAVDRSLITFHAPVFVETHLAAGPFRHLMMAQDTGSAIVGSARGDIFFGSGDAAFALAARVRDTARFTLLVPREV